MLTAIKYRLPVRKSFFLLILAIATACHQGRIDSGSSETDIRINELLKKMSLEEKVGQMTQVTLDVLAYGDGPYSSYEPLMLDTVMLRKAFEKYHIGSVLNVANNRARDPQEWNRIIRQIQEYSIRYSPNGIPVVYGLDMIHGASYVAGATLFPQQIGMAATWNPDLACTEGEITAYETKATGATWIFSPVMDLGVDPRWPRFWETYGEDPYLASAMGEAYIRGLQGNTNTLSDSTHVAACLKHFLGYSQPRTGKDRTPAQIPAQSLFEYHLPPFENAIKAGAQSVMVNSSVINGTPVHASPYLLTDILRRKLGFTGVAVSDWQDIEYLFSRHKVAGSRKDAVKLAVNAGIDLSMVPYNFAFADYLIQLVKEGEVPETRINEAAGRILRFKLEMGLFDQPVTNAAGYPEFGSAHFAALARQTAEESITLLKNEDELLPLPKNARILVAGPGANSMRPLNGGWTYSWQGELADEFAGEMNTVWEAICKTASSRENITLCETVHYSRSGNYADETMDSPALFKKLASQADYILLCLGENAYTETPGNLNDLYISEYQQQLVNIAASTGKPVLVVLLEGRPRIIRSAEPLVKGILQAYLPGNYGGDAIASVLFGDVNPSGKLPYTYPRFPNSLELYYHTYTEQLNDPDSPNGNAFNPQYEFGYGLSYSTFEYSNLIINKKEFQPGDTITGSVMIQNKSGRAGMEVIRVFVSDSVASSVPPVKRLRFFTKKMIQAGESQNVEFEIPVNDLAFINDAGDRIIEKGVFGIQITSLSKTFKLTETRVLNK